MAGQVTMRAASSRRTRAVRRATAVVSAFVLLMGLAGMALATTPASYDWQGNGYPNASCDADSTTALWIWTGDSPLSLTVNGREQTGSWTQMGSGSWHWTTTIDEFNFPPSTASITYTGTAGTLTLSHCDDGPLITPSPSPAPSTSVAPVTTPTPVPSTSVAPVATPTPAPSMSVEPVITPAPATSATPTPAATVAAETGTPRITPPPTDTLGPGRSAPSTGGWPIVLIGLAVLAFSVLALTRPRRSSRRP